MAITRSSRCVRCGHVYSRLATFELLTLTTRGVIQVNPTTSSNGCANFVNRSLGERQNHKHRRKFRAKDAPKINQNHYSGPRNKTTVTWI